MVNILDLWKVYIRNGSNETSGNGIISNDDVFLSFTICGEEANSPQMCLNHSPNGKLDTKDCGSNEFMVLTEVIICF